MENKSVVWLDKALKDHSGLTDSVVTIFENLLKSNKVDFLTVSGRTKDKKSALEKIDRKGYKNPAEQMTDLTGIRIILYFESDVERVSTLINKSFDVDADNSLDKSKVLSKDQIGYRSVHFVCTLGKTRAKLPEYSSLTGLKFEVQVRTVLQHAWAELAHDSNYKFSGTLPPEIDRKLYLYAGMLEIADKGFDELSSQIDKYKESIEERSKSGDYSTSIDSISLNKFFNSWVENNGIDVSSSPKNINELIVELNAFGVTTLEELINIIPPKYADVYKEINYSSNILGIVRDWMLINNWEHFVDEVPFNWVVDDEAMVTLDKFIKDEQLKGMLNALEALGNLALEDYEY
ncbi:RelA/SpoT domain protein [Vibrio sinaloensis DSM 21326]|uniref:RelA/SpoT domain protein n=1 Tax=Vibrio sinaloensis DSM 21326 TaxID=945550 RepID=E8M4V9_PHOS4|nr:GTP pyrophosphokinase [Vibrio sinaloensis]EGA70937.1 RelA/SpoT domain protein [Vibrio sinaloensis DSM 21326]